MWVGPVSRKRRWSSKVRASSRVRGEKADRPNGGRKLNYERENDFPILLGEGRAQRRERPNRLTRK